MLSHWDNILGPRVVHVWNMGTSSLDSGFLSRISSQSLSGEICREVTSFIDHKLYEIPDADVFVTAFIFTAMGISGPCVHALSIVIQKSDMTFFLNIQQLFLKCFERIIRKFKVNLDQVIYLFYYFMHMISVVFHLKSIFTFISVYMQSKCMFVLHVLWYLWKCWTFEKMSSTYFRFHLTQHLKELTRSLMIVVILALKTLDTWKSLSFLRKLWYGFNIHCS